MCQRKVEIHNRKFILRRLLERKVFSFLCIHKMEQAFNKAQISRLLKEVAKEVPENRSETRL